MTKPSNTRFRIGVDLGGTKIELIALNHLGEIRYRERCPTPSGDYDGTVLAIRDMVKTAETELGLVDQSERASVGIGIPGTISPATGLIKNANSVCLIGHSLDKDLAEALGRPIRLANDADCFALSEAIDGAGRNATIVFGVILGTGVGGGLVVNSSIVRGPNAISGEWGHNPLPWPDETERPGAPCYCGQQGCIETFLSGPALVRDANSDLLTWRNAQDLADAVVDGNPAARAAFSRYHLRLAKALASVINVIDPDVVVLGGGLSNIGSLYSAVPALWDPYVFSDSVVTRLLPPAHGDSSGVRGAAWLWPEETA